MPTRNSWSLPSGRASPRTRWLNPGHISWPTQRARKHCRGEACLAPATTRRNAYPQRSSLGSIILVGLLLAGEDLVGDEAGILPDGSFDLAGEVRIGLEENLRVLAALADALVVIGKPGAGFLNHA